MDPTPSFLSEAIDYCINRTEQNATGLTDFPEMTGPDGKWICEPDGGWVGGHWTGLLWLAYAFTQKPAFERAARQWTARLAPRQFDTTTHDLGFLFELSHILGSKLTSDTALLTPAIQAASTLTRRFNPRGGYFQAWGPLDGTFEQRGRAIVDTMMNLDLMFFTSKITGEPEFAEMAITHARTAQLRHMRPDATTSHVTDFNPETGEFIKQDTAQGLSPTSCWSRGQAWAVYGYAETYRETGDSQYLETSRALAGYMLDHQPTDRIPYWDFNSPLIPNDVRDSSAAAILASGLLILAKVETDPARAEQWRAEAAQTLESLWLNYSSRGCLEQSILVHGTRSKPHGYMDHGLIYGDYYFLEALLRLARPELDL